MIFRLSNCIGLMWKQQLGNQLKSCRATFSTAITTPGPTSASINQKVVFSGIQPTGVPHLGNYLGALLQWVKLQKSCDESDTLIYSLVDLHAITIRQDAQQLQRWKRESLATLLAIGLDPKRCIIFHQSDVPAHAELMWILSCTASVGYLSRMTQWKSKLALPENAKPMETPLQLGLFSYPVLQAADVLVHRATHVPVGEDQSQHLEFTRNCAIGFNHHFGQVFPEPVTLLSPAKRVMSLATPNKKMSKSDANDKSRISIIDADDVIAKKIKSAVTDSEDGITYDNEKRPALSNLINLMYYLQQGHPLTHEELIQDCSSKKMLKDKLTKIIQEHLAPIRERYNELITENSKILDDVAEQGAQKARFNANATMKEVKNVLGIA